MKKKIYIYIFTVTKRITIITTFIDAAINNDTKKSCRTVSYPPGAVQKERSPGQLGTETARWCDGFAPTESPRSRPPASHRTTKYREKQQNDDDDDDDKSQSVGRCM